ncbi:hypothetical protein AK812_SmicGene12694 [Symbiodinium microadriaticum]|uniref:Uncharacterized protein n=1 Tax=Symbiodinium microadriaticum TaxID=2951 RepID=A0A1Q9EA06_SYMMI|nr:hypothetical protein AK812_SmicGene12694 [Symbiodinium microadriaticum]
MAAPADLGLKGDPPEALDAYTDPSSLDAPQSLSVMDFSQTKGLADMIAEGKLSTTFKFAYNQVLLAQREPLLYSDPNTLVVGSHDIDLPTVVASRGTAVRGVVYSASSIGKSTASYSVQLSAGSSPSTFATSYPQYATLDARNAVAAPIGLPRVRVNATFNTVLTGLGVASPTPVNYSYVWNLAWHNCNLLNLARTAEFDVDWISPVAPCTYAGPLGSALMDYSEHQTEIAAGSVLCLELPDGNVGAEIAALRVLLSATPPLRVAIGTNGMPNTDSIPVPANGPRVQLSGLLVQEVAQNMEVQNRNTLLFEGVSKSYRGDGGPTLLPPAKRGHTLGLFTHTPGPGIWDGDPTLQAMVSVQVVRTTKGSDSSRFVPQGVPIGLLQRPYYYLSAIRRRGDMINASLMKRSLKRGFLLDAAPQEGAELVYGIRVTNPRLLGVVADRSPSALLFSFGYASQTKKENVFVSTLTNPPAVIQVGAIRKRDATSDADASEKKLPRQTRPPGAAPPLGNVPGVPDAMEEVERNAPLVPELADMMVELGISIASKRAPEDSEEESDDTCFEEGEEEAEFSDDDIVDPAAEDMLDDKVFQAALEASKADAPQDALQDTGPKEVTEPLPPLPPGNTSYTDLEVKAHVEPPALPPSLAQETVEPPASSLPGSTTMAQAPTPSTESLQTPSPKPVGPDDLETQPWPEVPQSPSGQPVKAHVFSPGTESLGSKEGRQLKHAKPLPEPQQSLQSNDNTVPPNHAKLADPKEQQAAAKPPTGSTASQESPAKTPSESAAPSEARTTEPTEAEKAPAKTQPESTAPQKTLANVPGSEGGARKRLQDDFDAEAEEGTQRPGKASAPTEAQPTEELQEPKENTAANNKAQATEEPQEPKGNTAANNKAQVTEDPQEPKGNTAANKKAQATEEPQEPKENAAPNKTAQATEEPQESQESGSSATGDIRRQLGKPSSWGGIPFISPGQQNHPECKESEEKGKPKAKAKAKAKAKCQPVGAQRDTESKKCGTTPKKGDTKPKKGDTKPKKGDTKPKKGDAEPKKGDAEPEKSAKRGKRKQAEPEEEQATAARKASKEKACQQEPLVGAEEPNPKRSKKQPRNGKQQKPDSCQTPEKNNAKKQSQGPESAAAAPAPPDAAPRPKRGRKAAAEKADNQAAADKADNKAAQPKKKQVLSPNTKQRKSRKSVAYHRKYVEQLDLGYGEVLMILWAYPDQIGYNFDLVEMFSGEAKVTSPDDVQQMQDVFANLSAAVSTPHSNSNEPTRQDSFHVAVGLSQVQESLTPTQRELETQLSPDKGGGAGPVPGMKRYVDTSKKNCQASAKAIELMKTEEGRKQLHQMYVDAGGNFGKVETEIIKFQKKQKEEWIRGTETQAKAAAELDDPDGTMLMNDPELSEAAVTRQNEVSTNASQLQTVAPTSSKAGLIGTYVAVVGRKIDMAGEMEDKLDGYKMPRATKLREEIESKRTAYESIYQNLLSLQEKALLSDPPPLSMKKELIDCFVTCTRADMNLNNTMNRARSFKGPAQPKSRAKPAPEPPVKKGGGLGILAETTLAGSGSLACCMNARNFCWPDIGLKIVSHSFTTRFLYSSLSAALFAGEKTLDEIHEVGDGTTVHLVCLGGKGDWKYLRKAFHMRVGYNCPEKCHLCMAEAAFSDFIGYLNARGYAVWSDEDFIGRVSRNFQTKKKRYEGGAWSYAAFERYRDDRLRELIHQAKTTVVKTEAEHDVSSLWDSAGGSAGASLNIGDMPLPNALKAKFAGLEVAGTKKIKRMLYRMTLTGGDKVLSRTFGKDEPGIPHRRLYPVDILSSDVFSYVERTMRGLLKHSKYAQVNKGQHHMMRQRWLVFCLCAAKKVWLNADADSWESQHTASDMRCQRIVESLTALKRGACEEDHKLSIGAASEVK